MMGTVSNPIPLSKPPGAGSASNPTVNGPGAPSRLDEAFRASSVFRKVGSEDRQRLSSVSRVGEYARGDTIFSEGDPSDAFYTVTRGRVKVFKMLPTGKEVILEIFGPGDPHLIPRIVAAAKAGKLKRIGSRQVKADVTYIDNAAQSQLDAADRLDIGAPPAGSGVSKSQPETFSA